MPDLAQLAVSGIAVYRQVARIAGADVKEWLKDILSKQRRRRPRTNERSTSPSA